MKHERERVKDEIEWNCVGRGNLMWRCLEEGKIFLSVSSFNLYYRLNGFQLINFKRKM